MNARSMGQTSTPDPVYDLISLAYHALQGAETYEQYAQDAQQQGDQELADYFQRTQQLCQQSADEAQRLLASRIQPGASATARAGVAAGQAGAPMGHAGSKPGQRG